MREHVVLGKVHSIRAWFCALPLPNHLLLLLQVCLCSLLVLWCHTVMQLSAQILLLSQVRARNASTAQYFYCFLDLPLPRQWGDTGLLEQLRDGVPLSSESP
jgi:hypothetical protein